MSASSFHFGFTGDDIAGTDEICSEGRPHELQTEKVADGAHRQQATPVAAQHVGGSRISPQRHSLEELLSHLPSQVSYSTLHIPIVPSERATDRRDDGPIRIPRREVFDIRMQLMASDEAVEEDDVAAGDATSRAAERLAAQTSLLLLGEDDIKTSVYEGGLKSWECSIDLVRVLARGKMRSVQGQGTGDHAHVLELGCGTALPSLYLFQRVLEEGYRNVHFTLADYNIDVLRLVTIPNLLLSWVMFQQCHSSPESAAASPAAPSPPPMNSPEELSSSALWQAESDVEITAGLLERFTADLEERGITIDAVSGPWGEEFTSLLPAVRERPATASGTMRTDTELAEVACCRRQYSSRVILASETIYSPDTLPCFAQVLYAALRLSQSGSPPQSPQTPQPLSSSSPPLPNPPHPPPPSSSSSSSPQATRQPSSTATTTTTTTTNATATATAIAFVAAKKMYFGVGGSVDDFARLMRSDYACRVTSVAEFGGGGGGRTRAGDGRTRAGDGRGGGDGALGDDALGDDEGGRRRAREAREGGEAREAREARGGGGGGGGVARVVLTVEI